MRCTRRRAATDPPRFCPACGRKLAVQVLPIGWTARCVSCGPLHAPGLDPGVPMMGSNTCIGRDSEDHVESPKGSFTA